jgi:hypothetical protein
VKLPAKSKYRAHSCREVCFDRRAVFRRLAVLPRAIVKTIDKRSGASPAGIAAMKFISFHEQDKIIQVAAKRGDISVLR